MLKKKDYRKECYSLRKKLKDTIRERDYNLRKYECLIRVITEEINNPLAKEGLLDVLTYISPMKTPLYAHLWRKKHGTCKKQR